LHGIEDLAVEVRLVQFNKVDVHSYFLIRRLPACQALARSKKEDKQEQGTSAVGYSTLYDDKPAHRFSFSRRPKR
jgi:hypothetical protein